MKPLPEVQFELPDWQDHHFHIIRTAELKMVAVGRKAGKGSDGFKNACRKLLEVTFRDEGANLIDHIKTSVDVRAFTYLLSTSNDFSTKTGISKSLLDHLLSVRTPISRLTLTQLIRAFFIQFDEVADEIGIIDWCEFIKSQLIYSTSGGSSELKRYSQHQALIFSPLGPSQVVKYSQKEEIDFDTMLKNLGLTGFTGGRFLTLCRYQYYLETLRTIPVGEDHSVLAEICKPEVVSSPYTEGKQLGHVLLEILIDRSEGQAISRSWQSTILTIAGDPRVPKSNPNYQRWWSLLGDKRISLMRGWLSRFDLTLFLKVLEQSAKDSSNSDMERMFESRKVFMEGLLKQGVVSESRLFLSRYAETYLKRHYDRKELPGYAKVESMQTSMIYLNLAGKVYMIEGSHSFKLKLFDRLPAAAQVANYGVKVIADSDLRSKIVSLYVAEFDNHDGYYDLTHDIHLGWQRKALHFLSRKGLNIDTALLIPKKRYREYKSKFGVR